MLDLIKKLKSSEEFKNFKNKNPECFLCNLVSIDNNKQIDFYCPETDRITSFFMKKNIEVKEDSEILKNKNTEIEELNTDEIKIQEKQAKDIINKLIKEKYSSETIKQEIIILQSVNTKPLWNITIITTAFNVLNIKINAINGKIIYEKIEPILNFKQY